MDAAPRVEGRGERAAELVEVDVAVVGALRVAVEQGLGRGEAVLARDAEELHRRVALRELLALLYRVPARLGRRGPEEEHPDGRARERGARGLLALQPAEAVERGQRPAEVAVVRVRDPALRHRLAARIDAGRGLDRGRGRRVRHITNPRVGRRRHVHQGRHFITRPFYFRA